MLNSGAVILRSAKFGR